MKLKSWLPLTIALLAFGCEPTGLLAPLCEDNSLPAEAFGTYRFTSIESNLRYSNAVTQTETFVQLRGDGQVYALGAKQIANFPEFTLGRICPYDETRYLLESRAGNGTFVASFLRMAAGWSSFSIAEISFSPEALQAAQIPFWFVPGTPDHMFFPRETIVTSFPTFIVDNRAVGARSLLAHARSASSGYVFERMSETKAQTMTGQPWRQVGLLRK